MEKIELSEKNKNIILNFGIILIALFIAFQIYKSEEGQINALIQQKSDELKKNKASEEIAGFEKKIDAYKKVFVKKDFGSVMNAISNIAKDSSVRIISMRPGDEEKLADYIRSTFLITLSTPSYHALGNFISQVERDKDIYFVSEVNIISTESNKDLKVDLKITAISYLYDEPSI